MTCFKCGGRYRKLEDVSGVYLSCWQCGRTKEISGTTSERNGYRDLLLEPALGVHGMSRPAHVMLRD